MAIFNFIGDAFAYFQRWLGLTIMSILPKRDFEPSNIKISGFTWDYVIREANFGHLIQAVFGICMALLSLVIIDHFLPFLDVSMLSVFSGSIQHMAKEFLGVTQDITTYLDIIGLLMLTLWGRRVSSIFGYGWFNLAKGLPGLALREEILFRAGSEKWSFVQKIRANLTFGLMHLTMVIVPVSAALALSFSGALLMNAYLRKMRETKSIIKAVKYSAIVHAIYNGLLLALLVILLITWPFIN